MKSIRVHTEPSQEYKTLHRSILDQPETTFLVKATQDARISLLMEPQLFNAPSYELEIGCEGNTKSKLHIKSLGSDVVFEENTGNILSDYKFRPFWISWQDGNFKFGRGFTVGQDVLLQHTDDQPTYRKQIHSVAVATAQWFPQGIGNSDRILQMVRRNEMIGY